jgi:hypothetical protein
MFGLFRIHDRDFNKQKSVQINWKSKENGECVFYSPCLHVSWLQLKDMHEDGRIVCSSHRVSVERARPAEAECDTVQGRQSSNTPRQWQASDNWWQAAEGSSRFVHETRDIRHVSCDQPVVTCCR